MQFFFCYFQWFNLLGKIIIMHVNTRYLNFLLHIVNFATYEHVKNVLKLAAIITVVRSYVPYHVYISQLLFSTIEPTWCNKQSIDQLREKLSNKYARQSLHLYYHDIHMANTCRTTLLLLHSALYSAEYKISTIIKPHSASDSSLNSGA